MTDRAVASLKTARGHMQTAVGHSAGVSSQSSQSRDTGVYGWRRGLRSGNVVYGASSKLLYAEPG